MHLYKREIEIKTNNFFESVLCQISMGNKIGYIAVIYRTPSQTASEFDNFLDIF